MILFEIVIVGLILSLATGGSVRLLSAERFRWAGALALLLPVQLAWQTIADFLRLDCAVAVSAWLLMMTGMTLVLAVNTRRRWTLGLAALGIASNILVIALNGAMPVSIAAASEIGGDRPHVRMLLEEDCLHEECGETTLLRALADVIPVPGPSWHRAVISVGDILMALGLAGWVFVASRRS